MKIILLSDVPKVGKRFDVKDVNSGHATNFLIPQKLAVAATPQALKQVEMQKSKKEGEIKVQEELLIKNLNDLDGKVLNIKEKINAKGHLFAGIHAEEISKRLETETRIHVDPANIMLENPIKEVGEHTVEIKVAGKSAKLKVMVEKK
ncbi:MAG: 50S ribosomal protein L9 [Candidatus Paceibacterota bacterium]